MTTLTHQFVQGSGFPDGEGCAFVVDGHGWTITDPICCRKSRKEHEAMTTPTPTPTPTPRTDALTKRMAGELDRPMLQQNHFIELCDHSRQLERDLAAAQEARQAAEARAESYKATIDRARRVMGGEGVEDQGQAWDQCLRILDAAIDAAQEKP